MEPTDLYNQLARFEVILERIAAGWHESQILEFKSFASGHIGAREREQLSKAIGGMSNARGGVIVVGIETRPGDDGAMLADHPTPLDNAAEVADKISSLASDFTDRNVPIEVWSVTEGTTRSGVVKILVPEARPKPAYSMFADNYYFRAGSQTVIMKPAMIQQLHIQGSVPELAVRAVAWRGPQFTDDQLRFDEWGNGHLFYLDLHVKNNGLAPAKKARVVVCFPPQLGINFAQQGENVTNRPYVQQNSPFGKHLSSFHLDLGETLVYPDSAIMEFLLKVTVSLHRECSNPKLVYCCYAENMLRRNGEITLFESDSLEQEAWTFHQSVCPLD